jgi:hypothetical protein
VEWLPEDLRVQQAGQLLLLVQPVPSSGTQGRIPRGGTPAMGGVPI